MLPKSSNFGQRIPLAVFIFVAFMLWRSLGHDPHLLHSSLIGKKVPTFSAPNLLHPDQPPVNNLDLQGRVTLFNVWASWCDACRMEHSMLVEISKNEDVVIYGLNYKDDGEDAKNWLQQAGDPYEAVAWDGSGKIGIDFGVYGIPETFLIDKEGIIRYKYVGVITTEVWETAFKPLIKSF